MTASDGPAPAPGVAVVVAFNPAGLDLMLIHHGTDDEVERIDHVRRFRDAMVRAGNECTLLEYEHAGHAFHYPGDDGHFDDVIDTTARFLVDRIAANREDRPA